MGLGPLLSRPLGKQLGLSICVPSLNSCWDQPELQWLHWSSKREAWRAAKKKTLEQCHLEAAAASIAPPVDHEILWRTAVHEAGHLVVASALQLPAPTGAKLTKNGGLVNIPASAFETLETARNRIATLFGGFAAELYIFGNASSGAGEGPESDLANATALADKICYHWGLEKRLAHRPVQRIMQGTDSTVEPVLRNCLQRASRALEANADVLKAIATALMSERELSGEQCRAASGKYRRGRDES